MLLLVIKTIISFLTRYKHLFGIHYSQILTNQF